MVAALNSAALARQESARPATPRLIAELAASPKKSSASAWSARESAATPATISTTNMAAFAISAIHRFMRQRGLLCALWSGSGVWQQDLLMTFSLQRSSRRNICTLSQLQGQAMRIVELARATGTKAETIRNY